ncbi:MAG: class I SAM-dependent methyltransferase [Flexilinea sp.]
MDQRIAAKLLELNQKFYNDFGEAFAATRRRIQPGIRRILSEISRDGAWLDLGCGSGALGAEWAASGRTGSYLGLDFSEALLKEARKNSASLSGDQLSIRYEFTDLMNPEWADSYPDRSFSGVLAFASIHHIPSSDNHRQIFNSIHRLLSPAGLFIYSVWQFQNSEKLMKHVLPWEAAGINVSDLEPGDTLLDWRYVLPGQEEKIGMRYVHLFSAGELHKLAIDSGFRVVDSFYFDGAEGNLALYQVLQAD